LHRLIASYAHRHAAVTRYPSSDTAGAFHHHFVEGDRCDDDVSLLFDDLE
jgi:hypothetical protein